MKRAVTCIAVLAVLFCVLWSNPSARVAFLRHFWSGRAATYYGYTPTVTLSDKLGFTPDAIQIAQRFPDSAWWQCKAEQLKTLPEDDDSYTYAYSESVKLSSSTYDLLVARFPQTMWLRMEQLNASLPQQSYSSGRQPLPTPTLMGTSPLGTSLPIASPSGVPPASAPVTPPFPGAPMPPGVSMAPPAPTPTPYSVDESSRISFMQGLTLCQQNERTEPRNAFWNWMRAYCLFRLKRDGEALAALKEGARKPIYNSHNQEEYQAALEAKQQLKPLDWAEKAQLLYTSSEYSMEERRSNVVALAVEQAELKERAGHHAAALQIYDDLTRLLRTSRLAATRLSNVSLLVRAESTVWSSNHRKEQAASLNGRANGMPLTRSSAQTSNYPFVTTASLLANYATARGRPDIAQRITVEDNQMFRQFSSSRGRWMNQNGLTDDETQRLLAFEWMGGIVAWQIMGLMSVWLLFAVMLGIARTLLLWRRRKTSTASPNGIPVAPNPPISRRVGWFTLLLAAVVPLSFSIGIIAVMFSTNLVGAVLYQYGSDSQSRFATLMLASLVLATSAILLAIGIGSWGAKRLLIPAQGGKPRRARWGRKSAAQPENSVKTDEVALLTMPDEVEMSWLPLSKRGMRQLCAPFNWMLSLAMPISWLALFVIGDTQAVAMPVAYLPGVASPVVTMDAPGWGFSILLTFLVVLRWVWITLTRDNRQWRAAKMASLAAENKNNPALDSAAATSPATAKRAKKPRRLAWNGMDSAFFSGVQDVVGVTLVGSFALYVALVWIALPLRAQANSYIDLTFRVGELQAVAQHRAAQQAATVTPPQSSTASQ